MRDNTDMAEDRTHWAEDRTILANERTFAGWMRTGMASVALAIGLKAVFGPFDPTWVPKSIATVFLGVALFIFWAARHQACTTTERLDQHQAQVQSRRHMTLLASFLGIATIGTGIILWWL